MSAGHDIPNAIPRVVKAVTAADLMQMDLPVREHLLAPWLPFQGLAMIYAPRGIGKTFFSLNVAYAVASGGEFLAWKAPRARKVVYIDGEMPARTMQERLKGIAKAHAATITDDYLRIVTPDLQDDGFMPDLSRRDGQSAMDTILGDAELVVVDNISCLCRSGIENEADSWAPVQAWVLHLRALGKSVLFVHHAGKGGAQRGTSRREDVLDTVVALKRPGDYSPSSGASFEIHFEKARSFFGCDADPLAATMTSNAHGQVTWVYSRLETTNAAKVTELVKEGLSDAEIARELGVNRSTVGRHRKAADTKGRR